MNTRLVTRSSTILVGLICLGLIMALVFWLDARAQSEVVQFTPQPVTLSPLAALPGSVTPAAIPYVAVNEDEAGEPVPVARVMQAPHGFRGRLFRCVNTLRSLPELHQGPTVHARFHPLRLSLRCRGDAANVGSPTAPATLLHVRFDKQTVGAIPSIGRGSQVLLQALGTDPVGTPIARFIRLLAHPRLPSAIDLHLPDLLSVVVGVAPPQVARCLNQGDPRLLSRTTPKNPNKPQIFAQLICRDRRGVPVPVLLRFKNPALAQKTLQIGDGTFVQIHIRGVIGSQLVADFIRIEQGARRFHSDDLRLIQLHPKAWLGKEVRCLSMGVPPPLLLDATVRAAARKTLPDMPDELSDRRAWLVCRQRIGPPVHLNLLLARGQESDLLQIGRGTEIAIRVLGTGTGHINGLLKGILDGGLDVSRLKGGGATDDAQTEQYGDLRRFVLLSSTLQGQRLRCTLLHSILRVLPPTQRSARQRSAEIRPTRVYCIDGLRTLSGQVFLLDFSAVSLPERIEKGRTFRLQFSGVIHAVPTAKVLALEPL